ncbi:nitrite/sulfite reductase [Cytobacillus sp. Hz8]|uniref:nitrite/sulfite reductase n=1 Tax=Cytobacillus sp. Hz8 TaxID=3347168 RepID=UPI0035D8B562
MAYTKTWTNIEKLNATEKWKLEKDGLTILNDIPYYAANGFSSIPKEEWDKFKWAGLYLQRPKEAGYFMMRVCVPSGILTNDQVRVLASIAKDFGRGVYDITTRQAIQFHWLTIDQIPEIYKRLESVGLSSIGACGDITRNIVGNPLAGIDKEELFDTTAIVKDVFEFFQQNEDFSNLPRKFKISISANVRNAANSQINCVSFVPAKKVIDGKEELGFHLIIGGGLSARPYLAQKVDVFVEPEQVKEVAIAVTTIFRDYGFREKRHYARLKFLMAEWGPEKFKEKLLEFIELPAAGEDVRETWNAGYFYGVHQQKQPGLSYVGLNIPVGRLTADDILELADLSEKFGNGEIRNCNSQNLIIPNIPNEKVEALLSEKILQKYNLNPLSFIGYSVSCTGIEYCNLALVETKKRMREIANRLDHEISLDVPVRIHMVGCPNSCGQRQIADIGLQGIKMKSKEKGMVEAFEIYVGGTLQDDGKFNEKLKGKIEADDLYSVIKNLLIHVKNTKLPNETFFSYLDRVGIDSLQQALDEILQHA